MSMLSELTRRVGELPPEKQAEVSDFVEFLHQRTQSRPPLDAREALRQLALHRLPAGPVDVVEAIAAGRERRDS